MTTQEFSNEFDTLLSSFVTQEGNITLDEYEKSVLLTQAQEEIVKGLYNGSITGESFENTEEVRRHLDGLITTYTAPETVIAFPKLSQDSKVFQVPLDLWYITYEQATISSDSLSDGSIVRVVPVRQDEWHRIRNNPFRKPNKYKVIRLDNTFTIEGPSYVELISEYPISEYLIRYLKKPSPIVLVNLPEDLSIDGKRDITDCKLNTALHRIILERAVQLAYRRLPQASK